MFIVCDENSSVVVMDVLIVHNILVVDGPRKIVADRPNLIVNDCGVFRVYYLRRNGGETVVFRRVEWFDAIVIE